MSYETAPSTALLATACALCGRPLRDAISVEAGVGPDCRKKYGYAEAQTAPDFTAALSCVGSDGGRISESLADALSNGDARRAANILVHRAALEQSPYLVAAISALGFARLAEKLAERLEQTRNVVRVTREGEWFVVRAPFNAEFLDLVRLITNQRWDSKRQVRFVHETRREALWLAIQEAFPMTLVVGTRMTVTGRSADRRAA
jgi:hypothetical protein